MMQRMQMSPVSDPRPDQPCASPSLNLLPAPHFAPPGLGTGGCFLLRFLFQADSHSSPPEKGGLYTDFTRKASSRDIGGSVYANPLTGSVYANPLNGSVNAITETTEKDLHADGRAELDFLEREQERDGDWETQEEDANEVSNVAVDAMQQLRTCAMRHFRFRVRLALLGATAPSRGR